MKKLILSILAISTISLSSIGQTYDLSANLNLWGVVGASEMRIPYHMTPSAQTQPITFCGVFSNIGSNDISDATYSVSVPMGFWANSASMNSISSATDTICVPMSASLFDGSFVASASMSTSNPDTGTTNNDFEVILFSIGGDLYVRDNILGGVYGAYEFQGNSFEVGNIFDIFAAADLEAIQVYIHSTATIGGDIIAKLYTYSATLGQISLVGQSGAHLLTASDLDNTIDLPLLTGDFSMNADESYLVTVENGSGGVIGTAGYSESGTSYQYVDLGAGVNWYALNETPAVRMKFAPSTSGLNETPKLFEMDVFPNPANEAVNVSFSLNNAADVNVSVTDLAGKVVLTQALGKVKTGLTEVQLNTAVLMSGVYLVNLTIDGIVSTERLVLRK